jgi:hypothetical protein
MPTVPSLIPHVASVSHYLQILLLAAALGAALGLVRPVRREIVPRSAHVIQAQILLAIVGALIIVVVAESLARAFAIVGAAGLIRYRARIKDPKDAGVMLVALAVGLTVGSEMYLLATVACVFVIALLWLLESFEPASGARFELKVGGEDAVKLQPDIEQVLGEKGVSFELLGSSSHELHYMVTVPFQDKVRKLGKLIAAVGERNGNAIDWDIKKLKALKP